MTFLGVGVDSCGRVFTLEGTIHIGGDSEAEGEMARRPVDAESLSRERSRILLAFEPPEAATREVAARGDAVECFDSGGVGSWRVAEGDLEVLVTCFPLAFSDRGSAGARGLV